MRIAVLASGRGSNLQALIDARATGKLPAEIAGVFSDRPAAQALARARAAGIPARAMRPKDFASREAYDECFFNAVAGVQPDLIVCAGYMRLISEAAVLRFPGRMINIHPSLLPKYPGLHTHARAIQAGDAEHGASVHYVIPALDAGPVIAQAVVPVEPGDDPDSLAARVQGREHPLLVGCVRLIAAGRLRQDGERVVYDGQPLVAPLVLAHDEELVVPCPSLPPPC